MITYNIYVKSKLYWDQLYSSPAFPTAVLLGPFLERWRVVCPRQLIKLDTGYPYLYLI